MTKIIFHFHCSHEQFQIGYCIWIVSFLHPAPKDFIGIILSSIPAFSDFILVSILHCHGSHKKFDVGYTVMKYVLCFQYLNHARSDSFLYSIKKKMCNEIVSTLQMPSNFLGSIFTLIPTCNSIPHA